MVSNKKSMQTEAAPLPPPPPIHFTPPAITQNVGTFANYYGGQFQVKQDFINYMAGVENGIKSGLKNGKWYPVKSVEGGTNTIAFGHKLQSGEAYPQGLTNAQAIDMLKRDIGIAADRARQITDYKFGKGAWERLDNTKKEMLTDFAFNGVLGKFPKFLDGVVTGNDAEVKAQYKRYVNGKEMKDRNQQFQQRYLHLAR